MGDGLFQIITTEEAERRGHIYDKEGATYLFDLDYVDDEYTVDAAHYGNISHFVNHSVSHVYASGARVCVCMYEVNFSMIYVNHHEESGYETFTVPKVLKRKLIGSIVWLQDQAEF